MAQKQTHHFAKITTADFIVRAAYQMGKTPLLPLFAASLGAGSAVLGFIVAVSTLTGMCLKPLIGALSDRSGRRSWLLVGTALFAATPFLYHFIDTPEQLLTLRLLHGLATAIYGPVTLAYVAERAHQDRAEKLGWFGMARSGGYIVGPAAAGPGARAPGATRDANGAGGCRRAPGRLNCGASILNSLPKRKTTRP